MLKNSICIKIYAKIFFYSKKLVYLCDNKKEITTLKFKAMKATNEMIKEIKELHATKGMNAVYAYIKRNNIKCEFNYFVFGWETSHEANRRKHLFMLNNKKRVLHFHRYSVLKRAKNGWGCNLLRGLEIKF